MIARRIEAIGIHSADTATCTLVHIGAEHSSVALVAIVALTFPFTRFIAAFRILDTKRGNGRIQTFVNIFTVQTVAAVAISTFTLETANGVLAFGEHIARSIIAFVFV